MLHVHFFDTIPGDFKLIFRQEPLQNVTPIFTQGHRPILLPYGQTFPNSHFIHPIDTQSSIFKTTSIPPFLGPNARTPKPQNHPEPMDWIPMCEGHVWIGRKPVGASQPTYKNKVLLSAP